MVNVTPVVSVPVPSCYCGNCDLILGIENAHIVEVDASGAALNITIETDAGFLGCPGCGNIGIGHGRDKVVLADAPWADRPVKITWLKRRGLCLDANCIRQTFVEVNESIAAPRAKVTTRAAGWAVKQMRYQNACVAGLARQLEVSWDTAWGAVAPALAQAAADESRYAGVSDLGVDEHVRHHGDQRKYGDKYLTGMVDLTPNQEGKRKARLLDLVPGRSGPVYAGWLQERGPEFAANVKIATLDPFQGYKNAIDDELEDATAVVDAFHIVKLGNTMVDDVRCRVQNETLGHRGRRGEPLFGIRTIIRSAQEKLSERQLNRLHKALEENEAHLEVGIAWSIGQDLRAAFHAPKLQDGKKLMIKLIDGLQTCPIPEARRLGHTLKRWRAAVLAYFDTNGANNGGSEAINGIVELQRRIARGIPNAENYILRMLLVGGGLDAVIFS